MTASSAFLGMGTGGVCEARRVVTELVRRDEAVRLGGVVGLGADGKGSDLACHHGAVHVGGLAVKPSTELTVDVLRPYRADRVNVREVARVVDDRGVAENLTGGTM